jgi:hypothetical protein
MPALILEYFKAHARELLARAAIGLHATDAGRF